MEVTFTQEMSKVKQLADAISQAISSKEYEEGQSLPSINQLSKEYGVSRDTVFKAFQELKEKGIVASTPTKGYYVSTAVSKVLLLLDTYSPFKYELHKALTENLPINYKVDLYFHQGSQERFNTLVRDSVGRYNLYLVMNYLNDSYSKILDKLDPEKVLLLDFGQFAKENFSYVCQGFDRTLYDCLVSGQELFKKYKRIELIFPADSEHPKSSIPYFEQFCRDYGFGYKLAETFEAKKMQQGTAYIVIRHSDLIGIVKTSREKGYGLGREVGVVVYNDEPMFEILDEGITAISTDFRLMGTLAAEFIRTRQQIQTYVPTRLIVRGSL